MPHLLITMAALASFGPDLPANAADAGPMPEPFANAAEQASEQGEDADIALLPRADRKAEAEGQAPDPGAADAAGDAPALSARLYVEDALVAASARRNLAVPLPVANRSDWSNRISADLQARGQIGSRITFTLSDRIDLIAPRRPDRSPGAELANNLREAIVAWQPSSAVFLEVGRINFKNGVTSTFNPTDFFRAGSLVSQTTQDPASLRENRLGSFMARAQLVWRGGSATVAFAPKLADREPLFGRSNNSFRLGIGRTNAAARGLLTIAEDMGGLSPTLSLFAQGGRVTIGLSASAPLGKRLVLATEWATGKRRGIVDEALCSGVDTGDLPALFGGACRGPRRLRHDLAVNLSWVPARNVTIGVEYDRSGAGMDAGQWRALSAARPGSLAQLAYWYVRSHAGSVQDPAFRDNLSVRVAWDKAFERNLNLSALALVNGGDGSFLAQFSADYAISQNWNAGLNLTASHGARSSGYGSLPQNFSGAIRLVHYF